MNNEKNTSDSIWQSAMEKIKRDKKCKPVCCIGPTGPTGATGPTHTLKSESKNNV